MIIELLYLLPITIVVGYLFSLLKLPKLLGYLVFALTYNFLFKSPLYLEYSNVITSLALGIILLKAGLGININDLKKIGFRSLLLGTLPNFAESIFIMIVTMLLLDFTFVEAGMTGFIISAVSPAVVVPSMIKLNEKGLGTDKNIPTLNLVAASFDDVVSLTMFGIFQSFYENNSFSGGLLVLAPISIVMGALVGIFAGYLVTQIVKNNNKSLYGVITVLSLVIAITFKLFLDEIHISSNIAIITMGILINASTSLSKDYTKFTINKMWSVAQVFLFLTIGLLVDINSVDGLIGIGVLIVFIGLIGRLLLVFMCLINSEYNNKEKIFIGFSNIPKATIQATIGSTPMLMGVPNGANILTLSVIAVLITAPLGLLLIDKSSDKLLK